MLPEDFDPAQAYGVLIFFHGNNDGEGGNFFPEVQYFAEMAAPRGLIPVVVRSPETSDPGSTILAWHSQDHPLVREWLQQDLGGCLTLDRSKVFFMGGSAGTNFLERALHDWIARDDLAGGVLGMCGEWPAHGSELGAPVARVRDRFKVFIEATTEDFLFESSLAGYDYLRYGLGVQVRADLDRAGAHCENSDVHVAKALDWMLGLREWPEDPAAEVYWRQTYFGPAHGAHSIVARSNGTYVAVRDPAIQSPEERAASETAYFVQGDQYVGYTNWLMDYQPQVLGVLDYSYIRRCHPLG